MKRIPWPFLLIAIGYLLGPFVSVAALAHGQGIGFTKYVKDLIEYRLALSLIVYVALPVLGAVGLLSFRRWSWPLVFSVNMAFSLSWMQLSFEGVTTATILEGTAFLVANLALAAYFLLPSVRSFYANRRAHWWKSKPRYMVEMPAQIYTQGRILDVQIKNISETGVLIETPGTFEIGEAFAIGFDDEELGAFMVDAVPIYAIRKGTGCTCGVAWTLRAGSRRRLQMLTKKLKSRKTPERSSMGPWYVDFPQWLNQAVTTGKGLVPTVTAPATSADAKVLPFRDSNKSESGTEKKAA